MASDLVFLSKSQLATALISCGSIVSKRKERRRAIGSLNELVNVVGYRRFARTKGGAAANL